MARPGGAPENLAPQFKKGVSGNPGGRPALPPELKAIDQLTVDEVKRIISKYARMTKAEISAAISDKSTPVLHLHIAAIFATGIKTGDYAKLAFLLDRTIGRAPTDVTLGAGENAIMLAYVPKSLRIGMQNDEQITSGETHSQHYEENDPD